MRRMPTDKEIDVIKKIESGEITPGSADIFVAVYGTTTLSDLNEAMAQNKTIMAKRVVSSLTNEVEYYVLSDYKPKDGVHDVAEYTFFRISTVGNCTIQELVWGYNKDTGSIDVVDFPSFHNFARMCTKASDTPSGISWKDAEGNTITGTLSALSGSTKGTMFVVHDHFNAPSSPTTVGLHTYVPTYASSPSGTWTWVEIARNTSLFES